MVDRIPTLLIGVTIENARSKIYTPIKEVL
jgi:hypothetical protein